MWSKKAIRCGCPNSNPILNPTFKVRVTMDELGGEVQVEEEEKVQEQEEKARLITQVIFL